MTDRRTFLGSLFAPLLGWFRKKLEPSTYDVTITTGPAGFISGSEIAARQRQMYKDLDKLVHIQEVWFQGVDGVYCSTNGGRFEKTPHRVIPFVEIPPLKVPW